MKTAFLLVLSLVSCVGADLRNVNGAVVDLSPIYQWRETNGPAANRPLPAWKEVRVMQVGEQFSVYTCCLVSIEGLTNLVLLDHLPNKIRTFLAERTQLEGQVTQLNNFITEETKRLRVLAATLQNTDPASDLFTQFSLDKANYENRKEELNQLARQLAEMKAKEISETTDLALQMNKKYAGMEIWDFGLRSREPPL